MAFSYIKELGKISNISCIATTANIEGNPPLFPPFLPSVQMSHFALEQQFLFLAATKKASEVYAQHQKIQHSLNLQTIWLNRSLLRSAILVCCGKIS